MLVAEYPQIDTYLHKYPLDPDPSKELDPRELESNWKAANIMKMSQYLMAATVNSPHPNLLPFQGFKFISEEQDGIGHTFLVTEQPSVTYPTLFETLSNPDQTIWPR